MKINECSPFDSRASDTCPILLYVCVLLKHGVYPADSTALLVASLVSLPCGLSVGPLSARSLLFPLFSPAFDCR